MTNFDALNNKKVALMGGAGFIGHNLALRLSELGVETHVVDGLQVNHLGFYNSDYSTNANAEIYINFLNERLSLLRQADVQMHISDLRDYHFVSNVIEKIQPDFVVHLAAIAHANRSNKDPYSTFDHSLRTLENVLDATRSNSIHVIYLSSSMVYGNFEGEPVREDRVCNPLGIYGALKYGAERLVIGYNQVFDLPYTIIRPSALYGERCVSRRVGQAFIENALRRKDLTISGDGSDALDFTYIGDLVEGLLLVMANSKSRNEVFNMTYGKARTINELAGVIQKHFPDVKLLHSPRDGLMPERGTLAIDKARRLLGYEPRYPLEEAFVEYIEWYKMFARNNKQLFE